MLSPWVFVVGFTALMVVVAIWWLHDFKKESSVGRKKMMTSVFIGMPIVLFIIVAWFTRDLGMTVFAFLVIVVFEFLDQKFDLGMYG